MYEEMPEGFWALPRADSISSEPLMLIYTEVCARMRRELEQTGGTTVDAMMAERTAFLYTWIRDTETRMVEVRTVRDGDQERAVVIRTQPFESQRNYKEIQQLWLQMAAQLQKTLSGADRIVAQAGLFDVMYSTVRVVAAEVLGKSMAEEFLDALSSRLDPVER